LPLPPLLGIPIDLPTGDLPVLVPLVRGFTQVRVNGLAIFPVVKVVKVRALGGPVTEIG
jgi:hypothetical protein